MSDVAQSEPPLSERNLLIRAAFRLEYITVAWMVVEAVVSIGAAFAANSLVLLAFGTDSLIELASAGVLLWRLSVELRQGRSFGDKAERLATRICGALLLALALSVVAGAGWKIWTQEGAEFSVPGLAVSATALPIMYFLSREKLQIANRLGSRALRADAVESITCGWLSGVVIAALVAQLAIDAWWVDPVASLSIVWFIAREGLEAWQGRECCDDCT